MYHQKYITIQARRSQGYTLKIGGIYKTKKRTHYKYITRLYITANRELTRKKSIKKFNLGVYKHISICNNVSVEISEQNYFVQAFCICLLSGLISTINLDSRQIQGAYFYT